MRADGRRRVLRLGILGCGRIGERIARRLPGTPDAPLLSVILCRPHQEEHLSAAFGHDVVVTSLDAFLERRPDIVAECASATLLAEAGPLLLAAGCDLLPLSMAAFADRETEARLLAAAHAGPGRIEVPAGAMGALGFLVAAREDHLSEVTLRVTYPPARLGVDDQAPTGQRRMLFRGTVREAAARYPRHLNVSVGVALAGLGLDATTFELFADAAITQATFEVVARAGPGPLRFFVGGRDAPVEADPVDYTTFTVMSLLRRRHAAVMI